MFSNKSKLASCTNDFVARVLIFSFTKFITLRRSHIINIASMKKCV
jgi:hypothetical protein